MQAFTKHTGRVAAMDRADVDTDQIIPKQFLKRIERNGFEDYLFFDWRFDDNGAEDPSFELNQPAMRNATVLVARRNFGCGSSREHAVWALENYGFRVVLAPSFADIFFNNCFKNGVLPIPLPSDVIDRLFEQQAAGGENGYQLTVDLEQQTISDSTGWSISFDVDPFRRHCLLNGLDDIALTLQHEDKITAYEERHATA
ncbi:MAG: 3-isopropylmalate dehydratase small subunit [Planctomycetales bacterium]|nr:3-isopropylmalate dehydratase small subunit [Planctomycetales bacterium]